MSKNNEVKNTEAKVNAVEGEIVETKPEVAETPKPEVVEEPKKEGLFTRFKNSKIGKIVLVAVGAVGVVGTGAAIVTSVGKKNYNEGYNEGFEAGMDEGWVQWGNPEPPATEEPSVSVPVETQEYPEE